MPKHCGTVWFSSLVEITSWFLSWRFIKLEMCELVPNMLLWARIRVSRAEDSTCPRFHPSPALSCFNAINLGGCVSLRGGYIRSAQHRMD